MDTRGYVQDAIDRYTQDAGSASLEQIIGHMDYYQRVVPTYDELVTALSVAVAEGRVTEVTHLYFETGTRGKPPRPFSGFSATEYAQAISSHNKRVADELARLELRGDV